jgi:cation diffusion facilitator family transporter
MASDVTISSGVLVGLGLQAAFGQAVFDPITAALVGLWVIRQAVKIFMETNMELMDGSPSTVYYRDVFEAVYSVKGALNPHRTRMRRIAGLWDIDIDIEVEPSLTVEQAHLIACKVERAIKERLENIYDIVVHIEPKGDSAGAAEGYGLSAEEIMGK